MDELDTSATLLAKLRKAPYDEAAWSEFVARYGPRIHHWCRQWQLQEADARDVTQTVLLKLAEKMRGFAYDSSRSFRGWLKTVTRNALSDYLESRGRGGRGSGDSQVHEALESVAAREDFLRQLEDAFDQEVLDEAMARVRQRVEPRTWAAFDLLTMQGCSGAEAARRLAMKVATVFVAKSKVQRMLKEEIQRMEDSHPVALEEKA